MAFLGNLKFKSDHFEEADRHLDNAAQMADLAERVEGIGKTVELLLDDIEGDIAVTGAPLEEAPEMSEGI